MPTALPLLSDPSVKMAKFAQVIDDWMISLGLTATAIQCWSSMQKNYGVNVCTIMSMMSEQMMPSACEVDIAGVVSMYALQLASGGPAHWWTGTTTTATIPTSAFCSTAAIGPRIFFLTFASARRPFLAPCLGKRTQSAHWPAAHRLDR